jgi:methyl-accepting chemotaxis protein
MLPGRNRVRDDFSRRLSGSIEKMFGWRSNADRANGDMLRNRAERMAGRAVARTPLADEHPRRLNAAAQTAEGFGTLIGEIAGQIDLLGASIESACAGKVGREFAMISEEVRTLAGEVRQAADGIAAAVVASGGVSREVTAALEGIKDAIRRIAELMANGDDAASTSYHAVQLSERSCRCN